MSEYDFIIIGGGTAGLTIASRLSEDPSQRVLVLEAGSDLSEDPRVRVPAFWTSLHGSDADWDFKTEPQPVLGGRTISLNQGKVLGGSSIINGQVFVPPTKFCIDAWESLGNPGWNWEALRPYFDKFYTSPPPVDEDGAKTLGIDGWTTKSGPSNGPIKTSFPGNPSHPIRKVWADTFRSSGYYMPQDPFFRASTGSFSCLATVDPVNKDRSDAASAYYTPNRLRENLKVITNATVEKILFETDDFGQPTATGVQYTHNSESKAVNCNKDVLLAAGALQSPKILELSGIGDVKLLEEHNIPLVADLPGVGENLHDHIMSMISFAAVDDIDTIDPIIRQEPAALEQAQREYAANKSGPFISMGVNTFAYLPVMEYLSGEGRERLESLLADNSPPPDSGDSRNHARAQAYYEIAQKTLRDPKEPTVAYLSFIGQNTGALQSGAKSLGFNAILCQPLSRGSVHIRSNEPSTAPVLDPKYLSNPVDLEIFAQHVLYIETIVRSSPLSSLLKQPLVHRDPSSELTNLETAKEWIRKNAVSMWHVGGSCAMLPAAMNGVVDTDLRVYGVKNLRVVDSSAIPLISTANLQATVYAFAEKAADVIKAAWQLK